MPFVFFIIIIMIDRKQKLSVHFSLEELTHTDYGKPGDNEPPLEAITNLITICEDWLEELRFRYNMLYVLHFWKITIPLKM